MFKLPDRVFIVAEAACNHECDIKIAEKMIKAAKDAGADAIKFQTYKAEKLVSDSAMSYWGETPMRQLDYYKQLDKFDKKEYKYLFDIANDHDIIAFSSPFDADSATMLAELGVPIIKVASCELTNIELLKHISSLGIPVIVSTGGCNEEVIRTAFVILHKVIIAMMACVRSNPATNPCLGRIHKLKDMFPFYEVGYSDHTDPSRYTIPMSATYAGVKVFEKHFTIDKNMKISNHFFAADVEQFKQLVNHIRLAEQHMGDCELSPNEEEISPVEASNRSWVLVKNIKKGEILTDEHIEFLRPGTGLEYPDKHKILNNKANKNLNKGDILQLGDIDI